MVILSPLSHFFGRTWRLRKNKCFQKLLHCESHDLLQMSRQSISTKSFTRLFKHESIVYKYVHTEALIEREMRQVLQFKMSHKRKHTHLRLRHVTIFRLHQIAEVYFWFLCKNSSVLGRARVMRNVDPCNTRRVWLEIACFPCHAWLWWCSTASDSEAKKEPRQVALLWSRSWRRVNGI